MPKASENLDLSSFNNFDQFAHLPSELIDELKQFPDTQLAIDLILMGTRFLMQSREYLMKTKLIQRDRVITQVCEIFFNQFESETKNTAGFIILLNELFNTCDIILESDPTKFISYGSPTRNIVIRFRRQWLVENRLRILEMFASKLNLRENLNSTRDTFKIYNDFLSRMDRIVIDYFRTTLPSQEDCYESFEFVLQEFNSLNSELLLSKETWDINKEIKY